MRHIRQLTGAADFAAMAAIGADAYPGTKVVTEEDRLKLQQQLIARAEQPTVAFSGLFDDQRLLGGMQLHDFSMNMFGTMVAAGGVGYVAVDLLHKKEAVAKELLTFLHTQADQIDHIFFNLHDDSFHHLLFDPRNGTDNPIATLYQESNTQGVGIMYRVVNVRAVRTPGRP